MNAIRTIRRQRGMTQQNLADALGCALITLQQYERGARTPSLFMARKIADTLYVPLDELYPGKVAA